MNKLVNNEDSKAYLESTVLGQLEGVTHRGDRVTSGKFQGSHRLKNKKKDSPVGVSCDIFVDALHADFDARAAVAQHLTQMGFQTVVGTRLDRDTNALGADKMHN
jgi:hypothetical protein